MFGVPQLDQALGEPSGTALLIRNEPGTDATPFLAQAVARWLDGGSEVVYLAVDRAPSRVPALLESWGFEPMEHKGTLALVDGYSPRAGLEEPAAYRADPRDLEAVARVLGDAARDHPGALLAVDSLSGLAAIAEGQEPEAAEALAGAVRRFDAAVALWTEWGPAADAAAAPLLEAFPSVVRLRGVAERVVTSQYFAVERVRGKKAHGRPTLFRAVAPGGVHVYIPKILVTGPFDAGKSSFVHAVSDSAVSTERRGTTVAMDRGKITLHGLVADVFGTPGQERFDPLLSTLASQAVGVVLVVDSTDTSSFERAGMMLRRVWQQGLPAVVAANKQDLPGALPPHEVVARLSLPTDLPVIGCTTTDPASARAVVEALIERILEGTPEGGA